MRVTAGLPGDAERWAEGCFALGEQMGSGYRMPMWEKLSQLPPSLVAPTVT